MLFLLNILAKLLQVYLLQQQRSRNGLGKRELAFVLSCRTKYQNKLTKPLCKPDNRGGFPRG